MLDKRVQIIIMLTIALTGGIGSGKTTVTNLFYKLGHSLGFHIIDADQIARDLLSGSLTDSDSDFGFGFDSSALKGVYNLFGSNLFNFSQNDGAQLDRSKLRKLIFSSEKKKLQLESLMHPLVYKEIFSKIEVFRSQEEAHELNQTAQQKQQNKQPLVIIIAIPLLLETHSENKFDRVLVVDTSLELQIQRSVSRDQCSRQLIKQIIRSQVDRQTRLDCADDVIDNSSSPRHLYPQIKKLIEFYAALSARFLAENKH